MVAVPLALAICIAVAHVEAAVEAVSSSLLLAAALSAVGISAAGWALALWRGSSRRLMILGAVSCLGLAGVWLVSRTVGLPIGGTSGAPVGPLDAATAVDEVLLACLCLTEAAGAGRLVTARLASGYGAVTLTCLLLSMGCGIGTTRAGAGRLSRTEPSLLCHLL